MNRTVPHHIILTILLSLSVLAHTAKTEQEQHFKKASKHDMDE
jgi:hypothetical protein